MRQVQRLAAIVAVIALSACASSSKYEQDPLYEAGFGDGCSTGTARAQGAPPSNPVRDQSDWDASDAYRAGWKTGYNSCSPGGTDSTGSGRDPSGQF